jgi:hypothetical protein
MQSREGMPLGKTRCWVSQGSRCLAQRWMAVGLEMIFYKKPTVLV